MGFSHSLVFEVTDRGIIIESNCYFLCVRDFKLQTTLKGSVDSFYALRTFKDLSVYAAGAQRLKLNVLHDCSM